MFLRENVQSWRQTQTFFACPEKRNFSWLNTKSDSLARVQNEAAPKKWRTKNILAAANCETKLRSLSAATAGSAAPSQSLSARKARCRSRLSWRTQRGVIHFLSEPIL